MCGWTVVVFKKFEKILLERNSKLVTSNLVSSPFFLTFIHRNILFIATHAYNKKWVKLRVHGNFLRVFLRLAVFYNA